MNFPDELLLEILAYTDKECLLFLGKLEHFKRLVNDFSLFQTYLYRLHSRVPDDQIIVQICKHLHRYPSTELLRNALRIVSKDKMSCMDPSGWTALHYMANLAADDSRLLGDLAFMIKKGCDPNVMSNRKVSDRQRNRWYPQPAAQYKKETPLELLLPRMDRSYLMAILDLFFSNGAQLFVKRDGKQFILYDFLNSISGRARESIFQWLAGQKIAMNNPYGDHDVLYHYIQMVKIPDAKVLAGLLTNGCNPSVVIGPANNSKNVFEWFITKHSNCAFSQLIDMIGLFINHGNKITGKMMTHFLNDQRYDVIEYLYTKRLAPVEYPILERCCGMWSQRTAKSFDADKSFRFIDKTIARGWCSKDTFNASLKQVWRKTSGHGIVLPRRFGGPVLDGFNRHAYLRSHALSDKFDSYLRLTKVLLNNGADPSVRVDNTVSVLSMAVKGVVNRILMMKEQRVELLNLIKLIDLFLKHSKNLEEVSATVDVLHDHRIDEESYEFRRYKDEYESLLLKLTKAEYPEEHAGQDVLEAES